MRSPEVSRSLPMPAQTSDNQVSAESTLDGPSAATEVRDRVEVARLVGRRRRVWRGILVLLGSTVLLLAAVGMRRDYRRREAAVDDMRRLGGVFDKWVLGQSHSIQRDGQWLRQRGRLPESLDALGPSVQGLASRYVYVGSQRRLLADEGESAVVVVFAREPVELTLGAAGRPVLFYKRGNFQAAWKNEKDFAAQRRAEDRQIEELGDGPYRQDLP